MKRSSLAAACVAALLVQTAEVGAIDPSGSPLRTTIPSQVQPQSNLITPGYNDPFFNTYSPGAVTPGGFGYDIPGLNVPLTPPGTTTPQGTPSTTAPGRTRNDLGSTLDPRLAPSYVPPGTIPSPTPTTRRWRLGVYSKDLDTGVQIMQVVPNGAAARARLEPEDVIVSVNGYQVGYVNGQLYDCSSEFERHATRDGWVTMLVQNRRDKSLVNVPVQLDPRFQTLTGSLSLDDRRQLPQDAIVTVELREIVRAGAEPITITSSRITNPQNAYPIPFEIEYDPIALDTTRNYVVHAYIQSRNRMIYQSTQLFPAFRPNGPKTVAVALAPIAQPLSDPYNYNPNVVTGDRDTQVAQIVNYFEQYLGRPPKDSELIAFINRLDSGSNYSLNDVQLDLLGHNQFFQRCNADKQRYIEQLHHYMVGRAPNQAELQYWMARYDNSGGIRRTFVSEFQEATAGIPR